MTNTSVSFSYAIVAMLVAGLLVYVMQKVEGDRWSKTDAMWLQWARRLAFVTAAIILLYSIESTDWEFTAFLLISSSGIILLINAVALSLRAPPKPGIRVRAHSLRAHPHSMARLLRYYFNIHR